MSAPKDARRGAIILAGGPSRRLGRPKALVAIGGVPVLLRVVGAAAAVVDDVVVVSRGTLAGRIVRILPAGVRFARDSLRIHTPLVGLLAGATSSWAPHVGALACDLPFVEPRLLRRLFAEANGQDATIPRWPDGRIEPLLAVYRRAALLAAARASLHAGERSVHEMIVRIPDVRFVPVASLRSADPSLRSFMNVNTPADLVRARRDAVTSKRGGRPRTR